MNMSEWVIWGNSMDGDIQDCIDHLIVAENAERLKESEL